MRAFSFCLFLGVWLTHHVAYSQGLMDILLGKSGGKPTVRFASPEKQLQAELRQQIEVAKKARTAAKMQIEAEQASLEKRRKYFEKLKSKYLKPLEKGLWDRPEEIVRLRKRIAALAGQNASLLRLYDAAQTSWLESINAQLDVLKDRLSIRPEQFEARLKKLYVKPLAEGKLTRDLGLLQRRLAQSVAALAQAKKEYNQLILLREKSRQKFDQARRALVQLKARSDPDHRHTDVVRGAHRGASSASKRVRPRGPTVRGMALRGVPTSRRSASPQPRHGVPLLVRRVAPPNHRTPPLRHPLAGRRRTVAPVHPRAMRPVSQPMRSVVIVVRQRGRVAMRPHLQRMSPSSSRPSSRPIQRVGAAQSSAHQASRRGPALTVVHVAKKNAAERAQLINDLKEQVRMLKFQFYRIQTSLFSVRLKDVKADIQTETHRVAFYRRMVRQMVSALKDIRSKMRDGLMYYRSLQFNTALISSVLSHIQRVWVEQPRVVMGVLQQRWRAWQRFSLAMQILWVMLGLLALLVVGLVNQMVHHRLTVSIHRLTERFEAQSMTRMLWGVLRLSLRMARGELPFVLFGGLFVGGLWLTGFPENWVSLTFSLTLLLMVIRAVWVHANVLFSDEPKERLFTFLDDSATRRFRRVIKGLALVMLVYIPLLMFAHALEFPEPFTQWMDVALVGFFFIGFLLIFIKKDAILSMIPTTHIVGRILILFLNRFYPVVLLIGLAIFGVYVWGYINLAGYLAIGLLLSTVVISFAYGLYRLSWVFGLWAFGFSKGEGGLLQVEKRWARGLLRLFHALVGLLLLFTCIGLLLSIWQVSGGWKVVYGFFHYPFIQVSNTQINLLSLGKLFLSMAVAFWLARVLKQKASEYLYPALRMTSANQLASNTALGYVVNIIGLLFGLQWMGVGVGVLAVFAGVIGIGVGFGAQSIANNFISGLIITFGQPIRIGDVIEVDGEIGRVVSFTGRSTTIETYDMRTVLIPNSEILAKKVINWSAGRGCVMVSVQVGVAYGSDVALVMKTLQEIAAEHPLVLLEPPPQLHFGDFGASSLDFKLWVAIADPAHRFRVPSELRVEIARRFAALDITIAFPQRDIHLNPNLEDALIQKLATPTAVGSPPQET